VSSAEGASFNSPGRKAVDSGLARRTGISLRRDMDFTAAPLALDI
jgi:hypothetical protein